jgi:hypothetical protein
MLPSYSNVTSKQPWFGVSNMCHPDSTQPRTTQRLMTSQETSYIASTINTIRSHADVRAIETENKHIARGISNNQKHVRMLRTWHRDLLAISRCVSRGWELWVFGTIVLVLCLIKSVLVLCLIMVLV